MRIAIIGSGYVGLVAQRVLLKRGTMSSLSTTMPINCCSGKRGNPDPERFLRIVAPPPWPAPPVLYIDRSFRHPIGCRFHYRRYTAIGNRRSRPLLRGSRRLRDRLCNSRTQSSDRGKEHRPRTHLRVTSKDSAPQRRPFQPVLGGIETRVTARRHSDHDLLYPDRIVVGPMTATGRALLRSIYTPLTSSSFAENEKRIQMDGYAYLGHLWLRPTPSAQLIKHASNAFWR